ncbi:MAG: hypothetical protein AAF960_24925, partial [Bacteroidota bacterium]
CFNSNLVRLKEYSKSDSSTCAPLFQFQPGAIKSRPIKIYKYLIISKKISVKLVLSGGKNRRCAIVRKGWGIDEFIKYSLSVSYDNSPKK